MKFIRRSLLFSMCIFLMTGCSRYEDAGKGIQSENSVDKVISSQMEDEMSPTVSIMDESIENESIENESIENESIENESIENEAAESETQKTETEVDFDLTAMSSDMVYATVYQMMSVPEQYEGKTFRMEGNFYATYYEPTQKYYYYCIIQDATACCAQGMEFVWEDGTHTYPDEYPSDDAYVEVEGIFETYREDEDENLLYCRLANATLKVLQS